MATINEALDKLERSRFRSSFYLTKKDKDYVIDKGMDVIRSHAEDLVRQKLSADHPVNDGKQTPMRGHPAFRAMHATACCCRGCLEKWWKVPQGRALSETQQEKIVNLMMGWIERQMER